MSQIPEGAVWAIFALPLLSLFTIVFMPRAQWRYAGHVAALAMGLAFLLSLWCLDSVWQTDGTRIAFTDHAWLSVVNVQVVLGLNLDGLSAIMLVVVTAVSFLVQVYSTGYMDGDPGYWRYFAYMSLFTASMLGLILFDSLLLIYVFWEMVGASSYLLIGFWFHRPAAAAAAKKAFLTTRLGDLGFLGAIILIYTKAGTFDISAIHDIALAGTLGTTTLTLFALGIFAGAAGKSAQVPFHVWLPDAMEGPTPVSALIHAATMVAAGVYLVARMFPVFYASPDAMHVVGAIGGITAISAALIGLVMFDIKRVLAYSTISQLGYMILALGSGAYVAAIFHLFTHAFFKALLFLGSGSVNHSTDTFDMRLMGGLRKSMPITFVTFVIGSFSLAGIFPFAGFWSKDEILSATFVSEPYLYWIALITAGLTAFYMTRVVCLTFLGDYRGGGIKEPTTTLLPADHTSDNGHEAHDAHAHGPHESPLAMTLPLLILAVLAVIAGFANLNHDVERLLVGALPTGVTLADVKFRWNVALISTALPLAGIALAWLIYGAKLVPAASLQRLFGPLHTLLANKFYADVLYERVIVGFGFFHLLGGAALAFDRVIIDGAVNGVGRTTRGASSVLRHLQTGQFQTYGAFAFAGLAVAVVLVLVLGPY